MVKLQPATVLCQEHLKPACVLLVQCGRVSRFIEVPVKRYRTYKIFGRHSLTRPKPRAPWESFYLYIHYQPPGVWSHWNKAKTQFISVRARVGFGLREFLQFLVYKGRRVLCERRTAKLTFAIQVSLRLPGLHSAC